MLTNIATFDRNKTKIAILYAKSAIKHIYLIKEFEK